MVYWHFLRWIVKRDIIFVRDLICQNGNPNVRRRFRKESEELNADLDSITFIIDH